MALELSSELRGLLPYALAFLSGDDYTSIKDDVRRWVGNDPIDTLLTVLIGGGVAIYLAERDTNDTCKTPWDGVRAMATILSHGDATPALTTSAGQAVATIGQAFGPALAFAAFQPTAASKQAAESEARDAAAENAAVNRAILARLEDIVRLLEAK